MRPINNWDNVKEAGGDFENLPAGGYICEIKKVTEKKNKKNNGTHLEIWFEVSEGEWRGFFERDWRNQTREDKSWHGQINQNIPLEESPKYDMQCGFFKRFINAIEDSNPGYHWAWDENTLVGRKCGVIFGEQEKLSKRGNPYTITCADSITNVAAIREGNYKIPDLKKLEPAAPSAWTPAGAAVNIGFSEPDGDLPF